MEYQNMRCDFHKYLASVSMYGVYLSNPSKHYCLYRCPFLQRISPDFLFMLIVYCTRPYMFPPRLSHNQKGRRCTLYTQSSMHSDHLGLWNGPFKSFNLWLILQSTVPQMYRVGVSISPFLKPFSWTYNFVEVSGRHKLEKSQTWGFHILYNVFTLQTSFEPLCSRGGGGQ